MDGNKKQNVIIILLTFIITLLVFLIGFVVGNKFNDNKVDNTVNNVNDLDEEVNNNDISYPDWMKYILDSDIQSITLTRISDINSESINPVKVNLTKDESKNIFIKLKDYNLEKVMVTGLGIPENQLDISYKYGEKTYKLSFMNEYINTNFIGINVDEQLIKLLNNSKYTDYSDDFGIGAIMFKFDDSYN